MNHSTDHHRRHVRLRDGQVRPLLDGEVIPDGATLFTPLVLRDAEQRPEPVKTAATSADAAYAQYVADLDYRTRPDSKTMAPRSATPEQAYANYCASLDWRTRER